MRARVSEAESRILEVLWASSPLSASEIYERLPNAAVSNAKTARALLDRLQRKRYLKRHKVHGLWVFTPAIERDAYLLRESTSFLKRFFGSDPVPPVAHLVNNQMLSENDIARLRAILDREHSDSEETSHD
jgi:predicted transcriptional regulator